MKEKLFVYGTLMKNHIDAVDLIGKERLRLLGYGQIEAELYDFGEYPGAVKRKGKQVYGEVYEIADSANILHRLDEYEEFNPKDVTHSLFIRRKTKVMMETGRTVIAIVYFYNGSTKNLRAIPDGRWKKSSHRGN
jgi:gamma-glutamylcyclotransferase (GGCT)/AIG2-like uncharacterized protein YtfP